MTKILMTLLLLCSSLNVYSSDNFPNKPIKIIVPFQTGGPTDQVARIIADALQTKLKNSVVVENKPGASATIGINHVATSQPDGHILLLSSSSFVISHHFADKLPYDVIKDFTHIILISQIPQALITSNKTNFKNVQDLINFAKNNPEKVTYGSNGVGTANYLDSEIFADNANIKLFHVPYKGQTAVITDVLGGNIDMAFVSVNNAINAAKTGKVNLLAITSKNRSKTYKDIPTLNELGIKNFNSVSWFGLSARTGTPEAVLNKLNSEINQILKDPEIQEKLEILGGDVIGGSRQSFQELISQEHSKYNSLARRLKQ